MNGAMLLALRAKTLLQAASCPPFAESAKDGAPALRVKSLAECVRGHVNYI